MSKRVLVTRAPHQASALADQLRARGLDPILVPTIDIAPPTSYCALDAALVALYRLDTDRVPQGFSLGSHTGEETNGVLTPTYHWLLFTSANAVEAFFQRLAALKGTGFSPSGGGRGIYAPEKGLQEREGALAPELEIENPNPSSVVPNPCRVAAIGPATARALESFGTKPNLIPPQAVAESLAAALLPHAVQPDGTPTRFFIPRAQEARNTLENALKLAGADVTIAPVYRNITPPGSIQAIQALFATPATYPDAITFTSSSTATNLLALLEAAVLTLPPEILRISIGPITSATLRDLGLPPHAESSTATITSLVEKVVEALEPRKPHLKVEALLASQ